jgi:hypothetical protein
MTPLGPPLESNRLTIFVLGAKRLQIYFVKLECQQDGRLRTSTLNWR